MNLRSSLKKILLLSILFLIFNITGTGLSEMTFQPPVVNLKKVRILGMDQKAVFLEGDLEIFNPNDLGSRFSGYHYQLEVEGRLLLSGSSDQPFAVQAQGTFSITIPATLLFEDLLALGQTGLFDREVRVRLSGTVFWDSWMAKLPLPFSCEGTINLSELLREQVRQFLEGL